MIDSLPLLADCELAQIDIGVANGRFSAATVSRPPAHGMLN
jgi:hypothetical protein